MVEGHHGRRRTTHGRQAGAGGYGPRMKRKAWMCLLPSCEAPVKSVATSREINAGGDTTELRTPAVNVLCASGEKTGGGVGRGELRLILL
jgi:hypothetical protein